jgi:soluble lytic murein transglycosylase-like protein
MRLLTLGLFVLVILLVWSIITRFQTEILSAKSGQPMTLSQPVPLTATIALISKDAVILTLPPKPQPQIKAEMTYEEMFQEIAPQYNLDWRLLAELAYQESLMDPLAIGKDNDMGLMQIIPSTWDAWAPQVGVSDPFDPYSNILVGAAYLAYVRDYARNRGHTDDYWMLIGYNGGPENLDRLFAHNGDWAEVPAKQRNYALAILKATYNKTDRWRQE